MERLAIPLFYGACVFGALAMAIASRRRVLIELAELLTISWGVCNVVVETRGVIRAPLYLPALDACLAAAVCALAVYHKSRAALLVLSFYVPIGLLHVGAFVLHAQGGYIYFLAHNLLFLGQVAVVGGWSGRVYLADRLHSGGDVVRIRAHRG